MGSLAEAFVRLIPDVAGFGAKARAEIAGQMAGAGRDAGSNYGKDFGSAAKSETTSASRTIRKDMSNTIGDGGNDAGGMFSRLFHSSLDKNTSDRSTVSGITRRMSSWFGEGGDSSGRDFGTKFGRSAADNAVFSIVNIFRGKFAAEMAVILLIAAPFLGAILAAGITAIIGLGAIGVAIAAQIHNPAVQDALKRFGAAFSTAIKALTQPFVEPITHGIDLITDNMKKNLPKMQGGFDALSKAVVPLADGVGKFFDKVTPSMDKLLKNSGPVIQQFAKDLPGIGASLSKFLDLISGSPGKVFALHSAITIFNGAVVGLGYTINGLAKAFDWMHTKFKQVEDFFKGSSGPAKDFRSAIDEVKKSWDRLKNAWDDFYKVIKPHIPDLEHLGKILGGAAVITAIVSAIGVLNALAIGIRMLSIEIRGAELVYRALRAAWDATFHAMYVAWQWFDREVIHPVVRFFSTDIPHWAEFAAHNVADWWHNMVNWVIGGWQWFDNSVIHPVVRFFVTDLPNWVSSAVNAVKSWWNGMINSLTDAWNRVWNAVCSPIINFFQHTLPDWVSSGTNAAKGFWQDFSNAIGAIWDWIKNHVFSPIVDFITHTIPDAFNNGVKAIGRFWEDMKSLVAKPINFVINTVLNSGILKAYNFIADKFGVGPKNVHVDPIPGYSGGGYTGDGGQFQPAGIVHAGEYVIPQEQTEKNLPLLEAIHSGAFSLDRDSLSRKDTRLLPGYFLGGLVGKLEGTFENAASHVVKSITGLGQQAIDLVMNPGKVLTEEFDSLMGGLKGNGITHDTPVGVGKTALNDVIEWIKTHLTPFFGQNSADVVAIQQWLTSHVNGLPYTWGAVGPNTFDCSGLVGEVIARVLHMKSYQRYFTTPDEASFLQSHGFHKGKDGDLIVGFSGVHTMGQIGGLPFEAGSTPIRVGSGTSGVMSFPEIWSLKIANAGGGRAPAGVLGQWIMSAIQATGVPASWAGPLGVLIQRESGGNPSAVNRSDSNAAAGHPSSGLAQLIGPTFSAHHQAGTSGDIFDPVANIAAAINYIRARYGDISRVQQANAGLPPAGYTFGGLVTADNGAWLEPDSVTMVHNGLQGRERVGNGTLEQLLEELIEVCKGIGVDVGDEINGMARGARRIARTR